MGLFWIMFIVALVFSSVGFKKYVWFISLGYGFSVAAIGVALLIAAREVLSPGLACACILFVVYGLRLGGYLAFRELRSASYNSKMKTEIKSGSDMSIVAKCAIWISAALLYAAETAPVTFRIANGGQADVLLAVGMAISIVGLVVETAADLQKNAAKKANSGYGFVPHRQMPELLRRDAVLDRRFHRRYHDLRRCRSVDCRVARLPGHHLCHVRRSKASRDAPEQNVR